MGDELPAEEGADRAEVVGPGAEGVGADRPAGRGIGVSPTGDGAGQEAALDGGAGRSPGQQPGDEDAPQIHAVLAPAADTIACPSAPPGNNWPGYYKVCVQER